MTVRRITQRSLTLVVVATVIALGACSSDDEAIDRGGYDSARAVVDAHVEAARNYDIESDCELLTPDRRRELAGLDGLEVDTYCATVTAPIEADADQETKARTRALYSGATVIELERPGGPWFSLESADGSYTEQIKAVEVDGRWWIATIDSDGEILDEDHAHEGEDPDSTEAPDPAVDGAAPTTVG